MSRAVSVPPLIANGLAVWLPAALDYVKQPNQIYLSESFESPPPSGPWLVR